jgi:hypothetical protein
MRFIPDIIVTTPELFRLVLVADTLLKLQDKVLPEVEIQLEKYMAERNCAIGLLVTPERVRIYRNHYMSDAEESVEIVGEYPVHGLFGNKTWHDEGSFATDVQMWLDRLKEEPRWRALPQPLRDAVEENILPELDRGEVRASASRMNLRCVA